MFTTHPRRIPVVISAFVVLLVTLLLCLALLRFSGDLHLGSGILIDPNGVASGSMINPDGVTKSGELNPLGIAGSPAVDPNGLACGPQSDPNGHPCQSRAGGLLATGVAIDGNGKS